MTQLLERSAEKKIEELMESKKFPNKKICENFLAYLITKLNLDLDQSIGAWLDDDDYWNNLINGDTENDA